MVDKKQATMLKEGIGDAMQYLKKIRSKYDTAESKQFFNEINLLDDKSENGLVNALDIFKKFYKNKINVSAEYEQEVLKYSKVIYKQFYENYILNLSDETIITSEGTKPYQRDAFLFTCSFLYSSLIMNDKNKMFSSYQKCLDVIESFDTPVWSTLITTILGYILFTVGSMISTSLVGAGIAISGPIIITINAFYLIYYSIIAYFTRKRARTTGDIAK